MDLLKRFFGTHKPAASQPHSSQFHESETTAQHFGSKNAPRRELLQVVLRDTIRKHGIPSDWIECRILSMISRNRVSGLQVQFVVKKGQRRLLQYVQPFQDSFWEELEKFEPRAREWLFGLAWQFNGSGSRSEVGMPGPGVWEGEDTRPGGDTQPPDLETDELATDLQALYAIRDAALAPADSKTPRDAPQVPGRAVGADRS